MDFKKKVKEKMEDQEREPKKEIALNRFSPSKMCYCKRQNFLRKLQLVKYPERAKGAMTVGKMIHNWCEDFTERTEEKIEGTMRGIFVSGRFDGYVVEDGIYDIKTINGLRYVWNKPKPEHVRQLEIYMRLAEVEKGKLIYVDRSNITNVREHTVKIDNKRFFDIIDKTKEVLKALKSFKVGNKLIIESEDDIPFDKCNSFYCKSEKLKDFPVELKVRDQEIRDRSF